MSMIFRWSILVVMLSFVLISCQNSPQPKAFSPTQLSQLEKVVQNVVQKANNLNSNQVINQPTNQPLELATAKKTEQKKVKKEAFKKIVVGRVEWISTLSPNIDFRARVDTGAQSCSMHAENIKEKQIKGEKYVEFTTLDDNGQAYTFLKKVVKTSMVKGTSGVAEKRFVVSMELAFGKKRPVVNVNLNDRRNLKHRFLIGRNLLLKNYIVDVTQSRLLGDKK